MTQLQRFQEALAESEFDAAIISSEINQRYLSDFDFSDGYLLISPHKAYLLTDFRYIEAALASVSGFEVIKPDVKISEALSELILSNGFHSIAIEENSLSCSDFAGFKEKLPKECNILYGASELMNIQRAVKLPYEIERIEKAQQITDKAFEHILSFISPSVTEKEVALELEFFMRRNGAESTAFSTIAVSGCASSLPHGAPSDITLRKGFLTMDFGAKYNGYCSDMTRTVIIGKADNDMKKIYQTVLSAQLAALEQIRAGILCREADSIARSIISDAGFGSAFGHSLGHGVGMYIHERPSLSPKAAADSRLCFGNVVTVEPGIYLDGKYGCRIEDMIAVKNDGSIHNFTNSPKELITI